MMRSKTLLPLLLILAQGKAFGAKTVQKFEADVGNHAKFVVETSDQQIQMKRTYDNGRSEHFTWDASTQELVLETNGTVKTLNSVHQPAEYTKALLSLRDGLVYTMAPARYDWLVFGTSVLNLELQASVQLVDQTLGAAAENNCLFKAGSRTVLAMTGGVAGELDPSTSAIDQIWVRDGYEAVLSNQAQLKVENATLGHARSETGDLPELVSPVQATNLAAGRSYSLAGHSLSGSVRSVICRPLYE